MNDEKIIQRLEARLQDNPKSLLFARLADYYLKQDRIDEAIDLCEEGVKHHPSYVTGNFILSKAHLAKNDRDKAEAELKKVLSHDQQYLSAQKELGDLMARTGWENKAVMHYKDILRIDPMDDETRQILNKISYDGSLQDATMPEEKKEDDRTPEVTEEEAPVESMEEADWGEQLEEVIADTTSDIETQEVPKSEHPAEETIIFDETSIEDSSSESEKPGEQTEEEEKEIPSSDSPDEPQEAEGADETSPAPTESPLIEETILELPDEDTVEESDETPSTDFLETELKSEKDDFSFDIVEADSEKTPEEDQAPITLEESETKGEELISEDIGDMEKKEETPISSEDLSQFDVSLESSGETSEKEPEETEEGSPLLASEDTIEEGTSEEENLEDAENDKQKIVSPTLGEIYAAQGQYAKAIRIYETLLKNSPEKETRYLKKIEELKKKLDESNDS